MYDFSAQSSSKLTNPTAGYIPVEATRKGSEPLAPLITAELSGASSDPQLGAFQMNPSKGMIQDILPVTLVIVNLSFDDTGGCIPDEPPVKASSSNTGNSSSTLMTQLGSYVHSR